MEAALRRVDGVRETTVGYTGGSTEHPTYQDVCTGHAEAVRVDYAPETLSFERLLDVFWGIHDPTQLNRQDPDRGTQYRSAVFFHSPEQEAAARTSLAQLQHSGVHRDPIVTEIASAGPFYRAEEYHQRYFDKQAAGR